MSLLKIGREIQIKLSWCSGGPNRRNTSSSNRCIIIINHSSNTNEKVGIKKKKVFLSKGMPLVIQRTNGSHDSTVMKTILMIQLMVLAEQKKVEANNLRVNKLLKCFKS